MSKVEEMLTQVTQDIRDLRKTQESKVQLQESDLKLYNGFTLAEFYAMSKAKEALEKLRGFYESEFANMTVKELLTTTSNITLPTMVQARALLELKNWIDMRPFCTRMLVGKGQGKTGYVQHIQQGTYSSWTEGTALSAADPTLASIAVTLAPFGKVTQISDLLANTSAINFVEEIGRVHGSCVQQGILDKTVDAMATATGNSVSIGTKGDGTEASFTLANVASAINEVMIGSFRPDFIITSPDKLWNAFTTNYAVTQFTGALSDLLLSGQIPKALGLNWLMDPYFELAINAGSAWNGADGEKYAIVGCSGFSCAWGELETDPVVELYRVPTELGSYVVTHLDGGAAKAVDNSIGIIKHAA
jgi:hypothetical protein